MAKQFFLLFISTLFCFQVFATTSAYLDSVERKLKTTTNPIDKLNCLYTLSFEFGFIKPRVGINYGEKCLKLAASEHNLLYQLNGFNGIANAYETLANFDSAKYFHQKSFEIAKLMKAPAKMALTLFNIAICYKQLGEYKNALSQYLLAYKILEKQPSYNPRVHFYIGEMYMRLGNYKEAEYHSRLGIEKCILFNHDDVIHNLYINLAKCLQYGGKIDTAEVTLINTLQKLKKNTDKISISICLYTLGEVYLENKKYDKAYECFKEELLLQQEIHNENGIYLAYLNLGFSAAHQNPKNVILVQSYLDKAEDYFPDIKKNPDILIESNLKTAKTFELIDKPAQALNYYKLYYALNDSLLNKEKLNQIVEIQTKYETEKKEQQIQSLKQSDLIKSLEIKSQGDTIRKRNILIIAVVFFILLLLVILYIYQQKQNIKKVLEKELAIKDAEEKERVRMSKDIHDELGAKLSKINFLCELMAHEKNQNPHITETAETIAETSRQIVTDMRDLIWVLNPENNTLFNLLAHMREYASDYIEDFSNDVKLSFPNHVDPVSISNESHREILMTVKECLNNIVKHSQASGVNLTVTLDKQNLMIRIQDNGIGIPLERKSGNGLRNMKTRIESLNGEMHIKSSKEEGTLVIFNIPLHKIIKM